MSEEAKKEPDTLGLLLEKIRQIVREELTTFSAAIDKEFNLRFGHIFPCCEAVRRVEAIPGDASTLVGGECPVHGKSYFRKSRSA